MRLFLGLCLVIFFSFILFGCKLQLSGDGPFAYNTRCEENWGDLQVKITMIEFGKNKIDKEGESFDYIMLYLELSNHREEGGLSYDPWLVFGTLHLSTGEVINDIEPLNAEVKFISQINPGQTVEGPLYWRVNESDVFSIDSVMLEFDMHDLAYNYGDLQYAKNFKITVENFK